MNARQLRLKLEPLYRKIAETHPLDEFSLLESLAEITEIREKARSEGLDPSNIDKQLAISAIEDMRPNDYLNHYHHIHFYCPYLSIRPKTFTTFEMTEDMAQDYLELSLMQIDQVNTAEDLNDVINSAAKLYLANHHDLYIAYLDYICKSFDFGLPEVINFFKRENKGSCASSLSMSLSIVHNIIANSDVFMEKHGDFWVRYTRFLGSYASELHVKISAKAEDVCAATKNSGSLYYGSLSDYLVIRQHDLEANYNSFIKTGLWANENACNNFESYSNGTNTLALFLKLMLNGKYNNAIEKSIPKIIGATPAIIKKGAQQYIDKEDAIKNIENLKHIASKIKEHGKQDVVDAFIAIIQRAGIEQSLMIDVFGSRIILEHDMEL